MPHSEEHRQHWSSSRLFIYFGLAFGLAVLAFVLSLLLPLSFDRTFLIVFGVIVLGAAFWKPWWFWEHHDAFWLRDLVGDRIASLIYAGAGITMLYFGIFTDAHLFQR